MDKRTIENHGMNVTMARHCNSDLTVGYDKEHKQQQINVKHAQTYEPAQLGSKLSQHQYKKSHKRELRGFTKPDTQEVRETNKRKIRCGFWNCPTLRRTRGSVTNSDDPILCTAVEVAVKIYLSYSIATVTTSNFYVITFTSRENDLGSILEV